MPDLFEDDVENVKSVLRLAVDRFREATGVEVHMETDDSGQAFLRFPSDVQGRQFPVDIRSALTSATLGTVVHRMKELGRRGILVAAYVNPKLAERLREMDVSFLDTAGNAYINEPPIFVFIKGNRLLRPPRSMPSGRAFQASGLKMLFVLLHQRELIGGSFRDIAGSAGVSLGSVGWVMGDLKAQGFLKEIGKRGRKLINREKIIERWVVAYPERLRPKLLRGRYSIKEPGWWADVEPADYHGYWGGEVAAEKMTHYLKPQGVTLYFRGSTGKFVLDHGLRKDPEGDVEILDVFWGAHVDWKEPGLTPPLLVYADLLATGDLRNIETARMIYEQYLARLVRED